MNQTADKPEQELIEVLLDFIIVSATLAKQIMSAMREKKIKEGANRHVENQRTGCCDPRTPGYGSKY